MRIIDRYVIRQALMPFAISLLVFTFMLIIPHLIEVAEDLIAKGVAGAVIVRLMTMLLPMALGLTIPMSLLLGLLVAIGRLSADREFVAMQACGVSLARLLRPVGLLSVLGFAATLYVMLVAVPSSNQAYRELAFDVVASRAEGEVKPRVFFDDFPDVVLYVREIPPSGSGWDGVFMADSRPGQQLAIYLARRGRVVIDKQKRTLEMLLEQGTRHTPDAEGKYEVVKFDRMVLSLDAGTVFPAAGLAKGTREMSIAELRVRAAELEREGIYPHNELFEIQKKFSIPFACLVFGLIGLALGATNRRDGKLASFVIGIIVIFAYYVLLTFGQSLIKGRLMHPAVAAWLPNAVLGGLGWVLLVWRHRLADQPLRLQLPARVLAVVRRMPLRRSTTPARARHFLPIGVLDRYVASTYAGVVLLAALALAGAFYISTFIELSEKVFKEDATWAMLGQYFIFATPQYVYYIVPLSVLIGTLVTVGVLTKNSELVVMKACGISLYRVALPMLAGGAAAGGLLFAIEQTVLGPANRRAEAIKHVMRGGVPETFDMFNRRWVVGRDGDIYHYNYFDPRSRQMIDLSIYEFDPEMRRLTRRTYAERAAYVSSGDEAAQVWRFERGWTREFDSDGELGPFAVFNGEERTLESAAYFATEQPDPRFMSYSQLRSYTDRLRVSGFDVMAQRVALARKVSFPFVTLIMTLLAVPFAVTIGRSGALAGIGVAIALAVTYWTAISVFAALGSGGLLAPALAAWAPNLLFGAGAAYLLLTVRT